MNKRGQSECGYKRKFIVVRIDLIGMYVALDISRYLVFRPLPVDHSRTEKLLLSGWRREANTGFTFHLNPDRFAIF